MRALTKLIPLSEKTLVGTPHLAMKGRKRAKNDSIVKSS